MRYKACGYKRALQSVLHKACATKRAATKRSLSLYIGKFTIFIRQTPPLVMPVDLMFFVEEVEPIDQFVRDFAAVANLGFFGIGEPLYLYHRLLAQGLGGWEEAAAGISGVRYTGA